MLQPYYMIVKQVKKFYKYHNKCCKENTEKLEQWLEKYNQVSRDFYNGKYCNKEHCSLLKAKEQECEELKTIIAEAEEAPICFHCGEEPCIRQERDKYKKLLVDFKNVNKYLGHKYITLKKALDEIERVWETDQDGGL